MSAKFKEGDKVKIINNSFGSVFKIGDTAEVFCSGEHYIPIRSNHTILLNENTVACSGLFNGHKISQVFRISDLKLINKNFGNQINYKFLNDE